MSQQQQDTIQVYHLDAVRAEPVAELADIWDRLQPLLVNRLTLNRSEAAIQNQQLEMVRDGYLLMPSPFVDTADRCDESYWMSHRYFYRFLEREEHFWATTRLDRAYALSAIYFPQRRTAVTLYHDTITAEMLRDFDVMRAGIAKPAPAPDPSDGARTAVVGFPHPMHTLWNELPAMASAASSDLVEKLELAVIHEPLGPAAELFPELGSRTRTLAYDQLPIINRDERMLVGLGSWTITRAVQDRVRRVAVRHAGGSALAARNRFQASYAPIFWLSVKPPKRTCLQQAEVLARLVCSLKNAYPRAGFILNGVGFPWDYEKNSNYLPWFRDVVERASIQSRQLIDEVLGRLDRKIRASVRPVTDVSACEEIVWGEAAHFYFCHGGTMQHKIGWTHDIPGMVHSNSAFLASFQRMPPPVENGSPSYFLSPGLTIDDDIANYTSHEIARKDQNYSFTSVDDVAREVIEAFEASQVRG